MKRYRIICRISWVIKTKIIAFILQDLNLEKKLVHKQHDVEENKIYGKYVKYHSGLERIV